MVSGQEIEKEVEKWTNKGMDVLLTYAWMIFFTNMIICVVSLVGLIKIVVKRKRRECFIILTLTFYFASSGIAFVTGIQT